MYIFPAACIVILLLYITSTPPSDFPQATVVTVRSGASLSEIAHDLEEQRIVRSSLLLINLVILLGGENTVTAGDYYFSEPVHAVEVAQRIATGKHGFTPVKVTIPEGSNASDIAAIFSEKLPLVATSTLLAELRLHEGYLFPDTYYFMPTVLASDVVKLMRSTFDQKISELSEDIEAFGKPLEDVIVMASILEEEGNDLQSRKMISGVLWKRLRIGMPLQVDAAFVYVNGKTTYELSKEDLTIDSLYNTYKYAGLPPGPITNPGLESIIAAITPISSRYLYYLSDRKGNTYYAANFEEHKRNRERYLD